MWSTQNRQNAQNNGNMVIKKMNIFFKKIRSIENGFWVKYK